MKEKAWRKLTEMRIRLPTFSFLPAQPPVKDKKFSIHKGASSSAQTLLFFPMAIHFSPCDSRFLRRGKENPRKDLKHQESIGKIPYKEDAVFPLSCERSAHAGPGPR